MELNSKIYIAGNTGMVGSAILRNLESKGYSNFVFTPWPEYDLINQKTVNDFFEKEKPEYVIDAAAKVGGILANDSYKAQFIYENLMIQNNIIHAAYVNNIKKLLFLGSSCIYPKKCPQPIKEEYLLTGKLEPTNEPYAIAKISGIKMCESYYRQYNCNFISIMPTNLYGPKDNYDLKSSHVIPALIRKFHEAKLNGDSSVSVWGTGKPRREFLYVDDLADCIELVINSIDAKDIYDMGISHLNIGTGQDVSIYELASTIKDVTSYDGEIVFNDSKPDGTMKKLLDVSRINSLGFTSKTLLSEGLIRAYSYFKSSIQ
jgi:GDP-L-fucose synthase